EYHDGVLASLDLLHGRAVDIQGGDLHGVELELFVAFEARVGALVAEASGHLELAGGTRLLTLASHGGVETRHVDVNLAFAADIGGEIHGKAVGVVQREQGSAVELAAGGDARQRTIEDLHAMLERFAEALFFLL